MFKYLIFAVVALFAVAAAYPSGIGLAVPGVIAAGPGLVGAPLGLGVGVGLGHGALLHG